ncbi:TorD/DmsD family molecular chaperone [Desulfofustis glycolicus]|uniref:Nitrate reductase delta subunit n=1 Tax=Desulfofustis glycolicus DSM 9705 TaxID=1121409 RepID=A0A1M5SN61_9BACT|nr:molecular chaperone TorD family protein [Desulfofustis glycolicus]MCB2215628.1 molecular chaperone TorD family protein [Desulfobulbaceae bacterium]SHH39936.1 Nitrate reductase delta subunit [Desulfofustis glycolicus DSM 9705]
MDSEKRAIHKARAVYYGLFASLFPFSFDAEYFDDLEKSVDLLGRHPLDEQSGRALKNMKRRLKNRGFLALKNENERLFYRPDTASIPTTASYFCENRDDGRKRLQMIEYLLASPFRRNSDEFKEHEDHLEFIMRFMQRLIIEELGGNANAGLLGEKVFQNVLNEMVDALIDQLREHQYSSFYRQAALVLESFIAFERVFLRVNKPREQSAVASRTHQHPGDQQAVMSRCVKMGQDSCL